MKNCFFTLLLFLFFFGCTVVKREDVGVWHHNYSVTEPINIETDCPFLTDDQFNLSILDTTKMLRLDVNSKVELTKALYKADFEIAVKEKDESKKEYYVNLDPKNNSSIFYLYGKLNIKNGIKSLIILESLGFGEKDLGYSLILFNIKDSYLCSIVFLGYFHNIDVSPCPRTYIKNKILARSNSERRYFFPGDIGALFQIGHNTSFSTYTIDENGYLVFTKDKYYKAPCPCSP